MKNVRNYFGLQSRAVFSIVLFFIVLHLGYSEAQKTELKIGYFTLRPVTYTQGTVPKGAAIKLLHDVFENIPNYKLTFMELPFNRLIEALKGGSIDGAVVLTDTKERREIFLYPANPFYKVRPGIAISKKFGLSQNMDPKKLPKMNLGLAENVSLPFELNQDLVKIARFKFVATDSQSNSYALLRAGRFDALYSPDVNDLAYGLSAFDLSKDFDAVSLSVDEVSQFTVFRKGLESLLPQYERSLSKVLASKQNGYLFYLTEATAEAK